MPYVLFGIVISAAVAAVESKKLINSVIAFGIMGLSVCLTFIIQGSIDLALVQLAVETALLMVLVKATKDLSEPESLKWYEIVSMTLFIILFGIFAGYAAFGSPVFGRHLKEQTLTIVEVIALFSIGVYCVAIKRNLIKIIIGIIIMEYAVNLFLVASARGGDLLSQWAALVGLATTVVMVALAKRLYDRHGTLDISKMRKLKG
ncbi:MAG: NADH-quinone oxidoreductase subunit K [Candidatus Margulisiibacteriota bacterium]